MDEEGEYKAARLDQHFLLLGHRVLEHGIFVFVHHIGQCIDVFLSEPLDVVCQGGHHAGDVFPSAHHDKLELA